MKKVIAFYLALSLLFCACSSTKETFSTAIDKVNRTYQDKKDQTQLIGNTTRNRLKQAPYDEWFTSNYEQYDLNESILKSSKSQLKDIEVTLFMATWCNDSKIEVPRFLKIMDYLKLPESKITIVNFYRDSPQYKQSPEHEEVGLNIHRVPTFIFYKKGIEIGRIVESPMNSLETDISQILLGVPSKPKYRAVTAFNKMLKNKGVAYLQTNKELLARRTKYSVKNSYELNTYGYVLLGSNKIAEAVAIFEINALAFPMDANVFDSLAEGYIADKKLDLAKECYQKVLELDKENIQAKKRLAELK